VVDVDVASAVIGVDDSRIVAEDGDAAVTLTGVNEDDDEGCSD
jgi:hypothetical protein